MARKKRPAAKKSAKKATRAKKHRPKKFPRGTSAGIVGRPGVSHMGEPESKGILTSPPATEVPAASSSADTTHLSLEMIDALRALSEQIAQERASTNRILSDIHGRITRLEESRQQDVEDKSVLAEMRRLRVAFAGACKVLGVRGPTPALIGRAMHQSQAFSKNHKVRIVPREIFEGMRADRLSSEIASILKNITSRRSSEIAKLLAREFDRRFQVIVDMHLGGREPIVHGKKIEYRRFLIEYGVNVFRGWPDWDDDSEGISLADPPEPIASTPEEAPVVDGGASSLPSAGELPPAMPDGSPSSPPT
jgi:hypothetical protein